MASDPADGPQQPKNLPYERTRRDDGAEAMKRWGPPTRLESGWRFTGKCPRCTHRTEKDIPDEAVVLKLAVSETLPTDETYVVECDCKEPHADRPEGTKGCGAFWGVQIRPGAVGGSEAGP